MEYQSELQPEENDLFRKISEGVGKDIGLDQKR